MGDYGGSPGYHMPPEAATLLMQPENSHYHFPEATKPSTSTFNALSRDQSASLAASTASSAWTGSNATSEANGMKSDMHDPLSPNVILRKSCQHCRKRKIRCIPAGTDTGACKACFNKGQPCLFEKQSTMGRPPKNRRREPDVDNDNYTKVIVPATAHGTSPSTGSAKGRKPSAFGTSTGSSNKKLKAEPDSSLPFSSYPDTAYMQTQDGILHGQPQTVPLEPYDAYQYPAAAQWNAAHNLPIPQPSQPSTSQYPYSNQHTSYNGHSSHHFQQQYLPELHEGLHAVASDPYYYHYTQPPPQLGYQSAHVHSSYNVASSHGSSAASETYQFGEESKPVPSNYEPPRENAGRSQHDLPNSMEVHVHRLQSGNDAFQSFRTSTLRDFLSAFYVTFSASSRSASSQNSDEPYSLADPALAPIPRVRTWFGKAIATRVPSKKREQATADYARSLITPLWDGLPVDIIALVTTGKSSGSGPFRPSQRKTSEATGIKLAAPEPESLVDKLLYEDESTGFQFSKADTDSTQTESPYLRYAPSKAVVIKYFEGYFVRHPLAPLIINEKLFLDDLMQDRADDVLLNVIVGSAIARGPCLSDGGEDARDIGDQFFDYIADKLLGLTTEECLRMETCQAIILWGAHEMAHMRQRRANALWQVADVLLRERLRRFQVQSNEEEAFRLHSNNAHRSSLDWRDVVEHELTVNGLWLLSVIHTWFSLSLRIPTSATSVYTAALPPPAVSVETSASFFYAYKLSASQVPFPAQHVVRRTISRFADISHLLGILASIQSQAHARSLFSPDPSRPIPNLCNAEDARLAKYLLKAASMYQPGPKRISAKRANPYDNDPAATREDDARTDASKAFISAMYAVMALYKVLPHAPRDMPLETLSAIVPNVEALATAYQALQILAQATSSSSGSGRSRSQALILDALPRISTLLELLSITSFDALDPSTVTTVTHSMLQELAQALKAVCASLERIALDRKEAQQKARLQSICDGVIVITELKSATLPTQNQLPADPNFSWPVAGHSQSSGVAGVIDAHRHYQNGSPLSGGDASSILLPQDHGGVSHRGTTGSPSDHHFQGSLDQSPASHSPSAFAEGQPSSSFHSIDGQYAPAPWDGVGPVYQQKRPSDGLTQESHYYLHGSNSAPHSHTHDGNAYFAQNGTGGQEGHLVAYGAAPYPAPHQTV